MIRRYVRPRCNGDEQMVIKVELEPKEEFVFIGEQGNAYDLFYILIKQDNEIIWSPIAKKFLLLIKYIN